MIRTRSPLLATDREPEIAPAFALPIDPSCWPAVELPGWRILRPLSAGAQAFTFLVAPEARAGERPRSAVAKVYRAKGWEGFPFAPEEQQWRALREATALRLLATTRSPHLPRLLDFGLRTHGSEHPWLILPFYRGGPLRWSDGVRTQLRPELRGRVEVALAIAHSVASALLLMHSHPMRLVHRDLNLGNLFLRTPRGPLVVGDFGSVRMAGFPERPELSGAIPSGIGSWRPPELAGTGGPITPASDLFQLGGILYEALSGGEVLPPAEEWGERPPLDTPEHALERWVDDPRLPALRTLLSALFTREPERRPGAEEVIRTIGVIRRRAVGEE